MGIEIPDAVKWLTPIVVGASWPAGDETALRRAEAAAYGGDLRRRGRGDRRHAEPARGPERDAGCDGRGDGWVSGENNRGWRFKSSEGAVHGANVDSPYNRGFNSTHGQHIPGDGGPNNVNNNPYDDGSRSYSEGSAQPPSNPEK